MSVHEATRPVRDRAVPTEIPSVSVVVPAYNEAAIITDNLARLHEHMHTLDGRYRWEIVVVDDGSSDETPDLVDDFASHHDNVRALFHHVNFRLGQALRFAFGQCSSEFIVVLDADLSYSPDHVERLLDAAVTTRARVVIASPYMKGGRTTAIPFLRRIMSKWANRLLAWSAGGSLTTITGMVRAYDRQFLEGLNLKAMDNEVNSEIVYKAQLLRARIVEVPAHLDWTEQSRREDERQSSLNVARSIVSAMLMAFVFRPFMFFVLPGLALVGLFLYMLVWILVRVVDFYGDVSGGDRLTDALRMAYENAPYQFIIGGIALIVALQLFSLAIIAAQAKRYFEELFHLGSTQLRELRRVASAGDAPRRSAPALVDDG